ncbi:uncharacterized protein LOC134800569 [Cydia splendana]|uniref:uncharacterized protein LOC134800569 n=1 Tax=Cydia splendana TaxID=1100963 RepID=UPI00300BFB55
MYKGYTFSHQGPKHSRSFYCSRKISSRCQARLILHADGYIRKEFTDHNHKKPVYKKIGGSLDYEFINVGKTKLLMYKGYTFSRLGSKSSRSFHCSRKISIRCQARVILDESGYIIREDTDHNHEKPVYKKIGDNFIRIYQFYEFITVGKSRLLLYQGYTFSSKGPKTGRHYYCSRMISGRCPARITLDERGYIARASTEHNHKQPVYTKIGDQYIKIS